MWSAGPPLSLPPFHPNPLPPFHPATLPLSHPATLPLPPFNVPLLVGMYCLTSLLPFPPCLPSPSSFVWSLVLRLSLGARPSGKQGWGAAVTPIGCGCVRVQRLRNGRMKQVLDSLVVQAERTFPPGCSCSARERRPPFPPTKPSRAVQQLVEEGTLWECVMAAG